MASSLPSAPAALRNRDPIAEVLAEVLPPLGLVLEVASGTGEHSAYFADRFPHLIWQPSDFDGESLPWIDARRRESGLSNMRDAVRIDASADNWPVASADALLCINMVHISPWQATQGLMRGAGRVLPAGAPLILYGPYRRAEVATAPSNEAFDRSLRERDSEWGLRDLEQVSAEAQANALAFERLFEMPANNLTLVFRRA